MIQTKLLRTVLVASLLLSGIQHADADRKETLLRDGWRFTRADKMSGDEAAQPKYNDSII